MVVMAQRGMSHIVTAFRLVRVVAWIATFLASAAAQADGGGGQPYRLGIGDEIRVTVQDQPQISGQSTVVDDGAIALPLLDRMPVEGMTLRDATEAIRRKLSAKVVDPVVAVDVVRYRPFFVLGDVANPGMYPWFPGATVAQGVAVAGGYRGKSDYLQSAMAGIRAAEALAVARYQLAEIRVQEARLRVENEGGTTLAAPEADDPSVAPLIGGFVAREQEILEVRASAFAKHTELLKREYEIRTDEITALDGRIKAQGRQGDNLRREIAEVQSLISRGLSPTSRLNDLNREENRLQSDTLQTQVLMNQARNGRNQAELQLSTVTRERRLQILTELQDVLAKIQKLRQQLRAETSIVLESAARQGQPAGAGVTTTFLIQGRGTDGSRAAEENASIAPGDVLRIERTFAAPLAAARSTKDCGRDEAAGRCLPCRDAGCNEVAAMAPEGQGPAAETGWRAR